MSILPNIQLDDNPLISREEYQGIINFLNMLPAQLQQIEKLGRGLGKDVSEDIKGILSESIVMYNLYVEYADEYPDIALQLTDVIHEIFKA